MTPEVKKRIEQIRQGIVPEGYKKTESGIIPNEWRVEQVSKYIEEYKFFSNDISHIPVYSSSRKGLVPQSDYYNQREAVETNLGYKVVPQGYVTYRHMSDDDVFHFNINKTGENVLVSSEYPVFTSSDNCDLSFLISVLNNTARFRYFCKMQKLGGTRTRLYLDNLKRYALALPPFDEQKKIAEILSTQDKAIELQGRKIEELKRFKKGCLEKMFPRKGQKVPEKRFPGFTDDWEQRKLGEVSKRVIVGLATSVTPYYREKGAPILRNLNIKENYLDDTDILFLDRTYAESQISKQIHAGDVLTVHTGYIGTSCVVPEKYDKCLTFTTLITTTDESVLKGAFLAQYLNSEIGMSAVQAVTTQGGRQNLNTNDFVKVEIRYPSLAEQNKICTVLSSIDNLITLHQRKLEEMKKQKKALMQLLLTGIVRVRL